MISPIFQTSVPPVRPIRHPSGLSVPHSRNTYSIVLVNSEEYLTAILLLTYVKAFDFEAYAGDYVMAAAAVKYLTCLAH